MRDPDQISFELAHPHTRASLSEHLLGLLTIFSVTIVLGIVGLGLSFEVHGYPVYLWIALAIILVALQWSAFVLRDLRDWRSVALLQIALSTATGVSALVLAGFAWPGIVGFLAAALTGANGFKRLSEINAGLSNAKRPDTT